MKRLRIAIASAGRFHVLDLARELHALGHEVRFYSYVPKVRARSFGLPDKCHISLLPFVLPLLAWTKFAPRFGTAMRGRCLDAVLNCALMLRLKPCDLLIGMSGIYLEALRFAKERYGARIWLERGSRHIVSQDEILAAIPGAERPSGWDIRRELEGYLLADRIVVPSQHVVNSFNSDKSARAKLFLNPYGVDLGMFPFCERKRDALIMNLLYIGTWSLQKGCDILVQALEKKSNVKLTHVGAIGDCKFPFNNTKFEHVPAVNQRDLIFYYKQADAFVLASRQDGFGVVLSQALASGLPVICTDRTGGPDLAFTPALAERIFVVPHDNAEALANAIAELRDRLATGRIFAALPPLDRETLSWTAYGRRYDDELQRDFALA